MNGSPALTGTCERATLDSALLCAFELADDDRPELDVVTAAAVAFGIDPAELWAHIDAGIEMWIWFATLPYVPAPLLASWMNSAEPSLVVYAATNSGASASQLADVVDRYSASRSRGPLLAAADNPNLAPDVLARLARRDQDVDLLERVAANPSTPAEALLRLSEPRWGQKVRYAVAQNPSAPPEALTALVSSGYLWARSAVAENPSTPVPLLRRLATSPANTSVSVTAELALRARGETV